MPPKTRIFNNLLGQPSSVIREEFILAIEEGKPVDDILAFKGPIQLPSKDQVLRLYLYYREKEGKYNSCDPQHDIQQGGPPCDQVLGNGRVQDDVL